MYTEFKWNIIGLIGSIKVITDTVAGSIIIHILWISSKWQMVLLKSNQEEA